MTVENVSIANFVAGKYTVQAGLPPDDHIYAAHHEENHGIIRRSTSFGALLRNFEAKYARSKNASEIFGLHMLVSQSRTSEEVFTTHSAIIMVNWAIKNNEAREKLANQPLYLLYDQIGRSLVGSEHVPMLAEIALDAIARFCWSSAYLPPIREIIDKPDFVRQLNKMSLPDVRLGKLRQTWSDESLRTCLSVIPQEARSLFDQPIEEVYDPYVELHREIQAKKMLWLNSPDTEQSMSATMMERLTQLAYVRETLVQKVYIEICRLYANTDLIAMTFDDIEKYSAQNVPGVHTAPTGHEFPEVLVLRTSPLQVKVEVPNSDETRNSMLFFRRRKEFLEQFALLQTPKMKLKELVGYRIFHDWTLQESPNPSLTIEMVTANSNKLMNILTSIDSRPSTLAIWTSIIQFDAQSPNRIISSLVASGWHGWLICNSNPRTVLRVFRNWFGELNARWIPSNSSHRNVGALCAMALYDHLPLRGIVFPGSQIFTVGVVLNALREELGDDFRGYGEGPLLFEHSFRRLEEARVITSWIIATERYLSWS